MRDVLKTKRISRPGGFSLAELAVVMLLTTIITGVLVMFWIQSRAVLERGMAKTTLQQKVRMTATRVIPKVTSVIRRPETLDNDEVAPIVWPTAAEGWSNEIVLNTTRAFVMEQLREPMTPADDFDPVEASIDPDAHYDQLRLWYDEDDYEDHPDFGKLYDLKMNRPAPSPNYAGSVNYQASDTITLATGLSFIGFRVETPERVRFRLVLKDYVPLPSGQIGGAKNVETQVYETDIYLPVWTNAAGNSGEVVEPVE